eukprot:scaffold277866_cov51-Attheya_sp.AAC.1
MLLRVGCVAYSVGEGSKDEMSVAGAEFGQERVPIEVDSFEESDPALPSQSSLLPSFIGKSFLTGIICSNDVIKEIILGGSGCRSVTAEVSVSEQGIGNNIVFAREPLTVDLDFGVDAKFRKGMHRIHDKGWIWFSMMSNYMPTREATNSRILMGALHQRDR